jgi:hypothetical protein
MGVITTSSFARMMFPGINKIYGNAYNKHKPEWPQVFEKSKATNAAFEEEVGVTSFGLAQVKTEGGGITYDDMSQAFTQRYTHITYGLGFIITRETYEDNQYAALGLRKATALAFSMQQTREIVCYNILNRAFSNSYTYADGKELCATDHPNKSGGTWSNELATASDISESAIEQACIDINDFTNDRGLIINIQPQKLIIPVELETEAVRLLYSELRPGSAENDINANKYLGRFPEGYFVSHYLTDPDAWFIQTNCPDGLKYKERRADAFDTDNDFDTENAKFKATTRYSVGVTDPRCVFGSPGA